MPDLDEITYAPDGKPFSFSTLSNQQGTQIELMDWGATWISCQLALPDGHPREVLLGCQNALQYTTQGAYLGATIGRYANRIAQAQYCYQGTSITLQPNQGVHQLHGGPQGFNQRRWQPIHSRPNRLIYQLFSTDGDQGFPGNLKVQTQYHLTEDNQIEISWQAMVDKPCPINLTNHAYFNLDGDGNLPNAINQTLQLFADDYLPVSPDGIPYTDLQPVSGSGMDFRQPKPIIQDLLRDPCQQQVKGYDHAYLLQYPCRSAHYPAAILTAADCKVTLKLFTTAPALQFYSGNFLAGIPDRRGGQYADYDGIALESGLLPDSPNHPSWPQPNCFLQPGRLYYAKTIYQFMVS